MTPPFDSLMNSCPPKPLALRRALSPSTWRFVIAVSGETPPNSS